MKELKIKMLLDRSQPKAAVEEHVRGAGQMVAATDAATKSQKAGMAEVVAATRQAMRDERGRFQSTGTAAKEAGDTIKSAGKAGAGGFTEMASAVTLVESGMRKLVSVATLIRDTIQEASKIRLDNTRKFVDERERVAELASVMGKPADNAFTLANAGFNQKVGFQGGEGLDFRLNFQNVGAQFAGRNISQKEYEEYEEQAGKMTLARKLDPGIGGDFFGGVLGLRDFKGAGDNAGEEALAAGNASIEILKRGRGSNAVLVRQLTQLNSSLLNEDSMKGTINDPNVSATLISTAAEKSDVSAAEMTKASLRGLRDFNGDAKPLLDKAGVTPAMDPITALKRINPIVEAEARASGLKTDDVLKGYFHDHLTAEGIGVLLNKGVSGGIFKDREDLLAGKIPGMPAIAGKGPAMDVLDQFDATERGMFRKSEAKNLGADLNKGAEDSRLLLLREQATAQLKTSGEIDSTSSMLWDNLFWRPLTGFSVDPRELTIEGRMGELIRQRGKAAGVDIDAGELSRYYTAEGMSEQMNKGMNKVIAAGGNPLSDKLGDKLDALTAATQANTAEMQAQRKSPAPAPPASPPVRRPGVPSSAVPRI